MDTNTNPAGDANSLNDLMTKLLGAGGVTDSVVQAIMNDQRLVKLAEYDVTRGFMNIKVSPEQAQDRFAELKMIVLKKEATLAELESMIYSKYGVIEGPREVAPKAERGPFGFAAKEDIE